MANTASPYGLRPVKRVDGMPYAGATEEFLIDPAGEATNIFNGQVVIIGADGYIAISTATGADITTNNLGGSGVGAIGVFVGCEYVNAQGQVIHSQYYPSGTTGVVKAYVVTDPNVHSKLSWMALALKQSWVLTPSLLLFRAPQLVQPRLVTLLALWMLPFKRLLLPSVLSVSPHPQAMLIQTCWLSSTPAHIHI
jgi:hypothetical protein